MSAPGDAGGIEKAATGIAGFDSITHGGLPRGRATLVVGGAGTGKTLFGVEFLAHGAQCAGEPGVLCSFEETADELLANARSLGLHLEELVEAGKLAVDCVQLDPAMVTSGDFTLDALLLRLERAVDAVGARRLVIDTVEVLFAALGGSDGGNREGRVRAEFVRLLRWAKHRGLTVVTTGESGTGGRLTRYGIEEYVSDCVVLLDSQLDGDVATRRLRIAKYRGSEHGTNAYPFLITSHGMTVLPLSDVELTYAAPTERVSTGIDGLDSMLGGGVFAASTVLISGSAGTGKTSIAAHCAAAAVQRGERALFVTFEESPDQLVRNMRSIGIDLATPLADGLLTINAVRATRRGLESHIVGFEELLRDTGARVAVFDAIGSLDRIGSRPEVGSTLARLVDVCKLHGVTTILTSLGADEAGAGDISSLIDTWLLLRNIEQDGERNRLIFVIKSRGSAHSNQVREFLLTDHGARLVDVAVGPRGVLVGSARSAQVAADAGEARAREREIERRRARLAQATARTQEQILALQA